MLVTMKEILDRANEQNYAVVAPNVFSEMDARACLEVAEEEQAPIILDVAMSQTADIRFHGSYLTRLANQTSVPVAINLDHGSCFAHAIMAIQSGFTSIMVDRSSLPYEENIAQVNELCKIAHAAGLSVEAELGHVGHGNEDKTITSDGLTVPTQAEDYIRRTGVDCLAVAIGTAHGTYIGTPQLDFERLIAIKECVHFPLVLHGGSGTGDENIAKACRLGINKVNVCNELLAAMNRSVKNADLSGDNAYNFWTICLGGMRDRIRELIYICGSHGKAWAVPYPRLIHQDISMMER